MSSNSTLDNGDVHGGGDSPYLTCNALADPDAFGLEDWMSVSVEMTEAALDTAAAMEQSHRSQSPVQDAVRDAIAIDSSSFGSSSFSSRASSWGNVEEDPQQQRDNEMVEEEPLLEMEEVEEDGITIVSSVSSPSPSQQVQPHQQQPESMPMVEATEQQEETPLLSAMILSPHQAQLPLAHSLQGPLPLLPHQNNSNAVSPGLSVALSSLTTHTPESRGSDDAPNSPASSLSLHASSLPSSQLLDEALPSVATSSAMQAEAMSRSSSVSSLTTASHQLPEPTMANHNERNNDNENNEEAPLHQDPDETTATALRPQDTPATRTQDEDENHNDPVPSWLLQALSPPQQQQEQEENEDEPNSTPSATPATSDALAHEWLSVLACLGEQRDQFPFADDTVKDADVLLAALLEQQEGLWQDIDQGQRRRGVWRNVLAVATTAVAAVVTTHCALRGWNTGTTRRGVS